jgi:hypothetical protein
MLQNVGADVDVMKVVRAGALARMGIGAALALRTRTLLKVMLPKKEASGPLVMFARTVGIRDMIFGSALLIAALKEKEPGETRRWVQLWLANEVADVVAAVGARRQLGWWGTTTAAASPLPFIAADIWALQRLGAGVDQED